LGQAASFSGEAYGFPEVASLGATSGFHGQLLETVFRLDCHVDASRFVMGAACGT
jgi:hypothetical protein